MAGSAGSKYGIIQDGVPTKHKPNLPRLTMADFCKQCSIDTFAEDFGDLANIANEGSTVITLCEGCGPCEVDHSGRCVSTDCLKKHGNQQKTVSMKAQLALSAGINLGDTNEPGC